MPQRYEEIIKHSDELAERFKTYEPKAGKSSGSAPAARQRYQPARKRNARLV